MGHVPPKHYQKSALPTISCGKNADILDTDMVISMRMKHANSGIHMVGQIGISIIQRGVSSLQRLCEMWCLLPESHRSRQHGGRRGMGWDSWSNAIQIRPWGDSHGHWGYFQWPTEKKFVQGMGFASFQPKGTYVSLTYLYNTYIYPMVLHCMYRSVPYLHIVCSTSSLLSA